MSMLMVVMMMMMMMTIINVDADAAADANAAAADADDDDDDHDDRHDDISSYEEEQHNRVAVIVLLLGCLNEAAGDSSTFLISCSTGAFLLGKSGRAVCRRSLFHKGRLHETERVKEGSKRSWLKGPVRRWGS